MGAWKDENSTFVFRRFVFFVIASVCKVDVLTNDVDVVPDVEILSLSKLSSFCISEDDDSVIFSKMALPFRDGDLVSIALSVVTIS